MTACALRGFIVRDRGPTRAVRFARKANSRAPQAMEIARPAQQGPAPALPEQPQKQLANAYPDLEVRDLEARPSVSNARQANLKGRRARGTAKNARAGRFLFKGRLLARFALLVLTLA